MNFSVNSVYIHSRFKDTAAMLNLMQILIAVAVVVHALAAVFWMASSGMVARMAGKGAETLFPRQMGAVLVVVLTGGFLWRLLHTGGFGAYEWILAGGAACALVAAVVQGVVVGTSAGRLKAGGDEAKLRGAMAGANRAASALLGICFICMIVARFI